MSALNFLPGKWVLWKQQRYRVVDCRDIDTVLLQAPNAKRLLQAPVKELRLDPSSHADTFNPPELVHIPEADWRQALDRLHAIEPLLTHRSARGNQAQVLAVAEAMGTHPATIYRWLEKYSSTRRASVLLRKPRADRGSGRISQQLEDIISQAIKDRYLVGEKPDMTAVIEEVGIKCWEASIKPPHENTVRSRVIRVPERIKVAKREGHDAAEQRFAPRLGHFPGADYPLSVVQIDHTPMDVIVVDEQDRQPINRPFLTIVTDVFSRMILGFAIYLEHPSAFTSGVALAHAILPKDDWLREMGVTAEWPCWGKFRKLHSDNAKEFRGTVIGRACEEHNITIEFRPKGRPHFGGHVERGFRTFMKRTHRLSGTTQSDIKQRGKYDSSGKAILTRTELEKWFTIYIAKYYPNRWHRGIKDTPLARYKAGLLGSDDFMGTGMPEPITNPRRLLLDFMPFEERTVQNYGILLNHIYYYDDALRHWIGAKDPKDPSRARKFVVRFIPRDMREVYFRDPDSDDYIAIPYRDRSRPPTTLWEIREAENRLKKRGYANINEDLLFDSLLEMLEIEDSAARKTKAVRLAREKRNRQPSLPVPVGSASTRPSAVLPTVENVSKVPTAPDPDEVIEPFEGIVEPE